MTVARRSPVEAVITAIVTTLKATTAVTGLATGGIYDDVPQGSAYPYVIISSPSDVPQDTFGRFGANLLIDVHAVSQYAGSREAARIVDQCCRVLAFQSPTLSEHTNLGIGWDGSTRYVETVNSVPTRHHVATLRVWTEQSSS